MTNYERVKAFHDAFDIESPDHPTVPKADIRARRLRLLAEETREAADAWMAAESMEDMVQEMVDVLYIAYGALVEMGVDADAAFAEVHAANMSKLMPDGTVKRRVDGKVLKGPNYRKPDMTRVTRKEEHNG